ncbi:DNA repair protein RecN [Clostridium saccharoperbutylacetonicum]|uniref:DNA repair protein RecN n=1 Tax=Clostridium saccharoperbutylacetonicum N1-4(HMT) TaxID=931276 RepID=M1MYM9_9CLOT|nr:DNA repair protein RecN [Clostridium saccharoperbutylacetonicum]AGF56517.1 DNA repair protein RecN [Clostridium saccharoperbutylacetonicum N1-4(HMT)]AQR95186.1 DNA repair protein RecN [Clostridium saccharoperbutylacetonicum]NRT62736.1 DNA repair protein RecN (Recombination protein N) [Clostridium saccharoperbutylacetonicum]NSB26088.1 DNA repair protein RecN (Recombination protein N) [Clostridium saccharoperbutylacetonicum]NSB31033.1 DNA repair protein RecN (Recombination protein N) [Clostri
MLIQLNIKNFALIEEMTINFSEGFNILSGETGAGKSIMIDAIDFVLGGKFYKNLIRTGEDKTYVEALFTLEKSRVYEVLEELDIEYEDLLIISRESHVSGKNLIKVNGKSLITSQLRKIRVKLLDIHGQHQNQELLQRNTHIAYLDGFVGNEIIAPLARFSELREDLMGVREEIKRICGNQDREKLLDYLKFQIEDIEKAKLKPDEEENLKEEYNILANAEKINSSLSVSYGILSGNEDGNVIDSISKIVQELSSVENHFEKIKKNKQAIEEAFYALEEVSHEIRDMVEDVVYDQDALDKVNARIYEINSYKKKYAPSIPEILNYYEKIKKEHDEIINSEKIIQELEQKEKEILLKMEEQALIIHDIRIDKSKYLEEKILRELAFVGLEKSRMEISVLRQDEFNEKGFDEVAFLISTNPGEPLMPLEKVLSGGELSRIMLALKCVFAEKDEIPTLIFDEIDTGISGAVAQRVGEKMYQLSKTHQILCITHLPQIAVLSDYHYFVMKNVKNDKTFTEIKILEKEEKELEICKMLAGDEVTEATLNNVKEMIKISEIKKIEIKK